MILGVVQQVAVTRLYRDVPIKHEGIGRIRLRIARLVRSFPRLIGIEKQAGDAIQLGPIERVGKQRLLDDGFPSGLEAIVEAGLGIVGRAARRNFVERLVACRPAADDPVVPRRILAEMHAGQEQVLVKIAGRQLVLRIRPVQKLFPLAFRRSLLRRQRVPGFSRRRLLAALHPARQDAALGGRQRRQAVGHQFFRMRGGHPAQFACVRGAGARAGDRIGRRA